MTANGNSDPPSDLSVRIRSTVYLFGNYEMKAKQPGEINPTSITLILSTKNPKNVDYSLSLSFKHIVRIELLDNLEEHGAGMVVYMNEFMARRIEKIFNMEPNSFLNFRNPYMKHSFIIFDIVNSDKATISTLKQILNQAAEFHANYLIGRFTSEGNKDAETMVPKQYIWPIKYTYWEGLLATLHKSFYREDVTITNNNGQDISYTSGYIVNLVTNNKCAMQSDGRIMPIQQQEPLIVARRRTMDQQQSTRTFSLGRLPQADMPPPTKLGRFISASQPQKVDEVHTIDDDQSAEPTHTADDALVATYKPGELVLCKVYNSDLTTLGPTEMLNDTIIDFYMNYILNDIVPPEMRDDIYIFNSFFYTRLSKGLNNIATQRVPKARTKKIAENYLTLKNWTKNVNIFQKKYIVVPINEDTHWYLAVIVEPSLGLVTSKESSANSTQGSQQEAPSPTSGQQQQPSTIGMPQIPIFIFDSLFDINDAKRHRAVAELLLEYLQLEFRDKKNEHQLPGVAFRKNACHLVVPENVPQQQNYFDCGIFMLQFAESFLSRPPKFDELVAPISYEQLFEVIDLNGKREHIRKLITDLAQPPTSS